MFTVYDECWSSLSCDLLNRSPMSGDTDDATSVGPSELTTHHQCIHEQKIYAV